MGSNIENMVWTNVKNQYKKRSKEIKSDIFWYCKVAKSDNYMVNNIEMSNISIKILKRIRLWKPIIFSSTVHIIVIKLKKINISGE